LADGPPLRITHRSTANATVATVAGEIDLANVLDFRAGLRPLLSDPPVGLFVCDMSRVSFVSCSALSVLLDARETLAARGARLRVVANGPAVLRPLAITGLRDVLPVSPDLASALS
jgi:anti-anti-sigma factor